MWRTQVVTRGKTLRAWASVRLVRRRSSRAFPPKPRSGRCARAGQGDPKRGSATSARREDRGGRRRWTWWGQRRRVAVRSCRLVCSPWANPGSAPARLGGWWLCVTSHKEQCLVIRVGLSGTVLRVGRSHTPPLARPRDHLAATRTASAVHASVSGDASANKRRRPREPTDNEATKSKRCARCRRVPRTRRSGSRRPPFAASFPPEGREERPHSCGVAPRASRCPARTAAVRG
jgi:hypothetical protein